MTGTAAERSGRSARRFRAPLHLHIAALFVVLLAAFGLGLGWVAGNGSRTLVDEAATAAFRGSADLALDSLRRLETTARAAAEALAVDAATLAPAGARAGALPVLAAILRVTAGVSAAYVGWPDGDFVLMRPIGSHGDQLSAPTGTAWVVQWIERGDQRFEFLDGGLALLESRDRPEPPFDPRTRPWFVDALASPGSVVTAPYVFFTTLEPGITAARSASSGAVAGVDMSLWDLSDRLPAGRPTPSSEAAILDREGGVLADADVARLEQAIGGRASASVRHLPAAAEMGSPILAALARQAPQGAFSGTLAAAGREWRAAVTPLGDQGIHLVMAAPMDELAAGPAAIRARMLQILVLALLACIPLAWLAARLVARPVGAFAREVDAAARLEFAPRVTGATRIAELGMLGDSIEAMRSSLAGFATATRGFAEEEDLRRLLGGTIDALAAASSATGGAVWLVGPDGPHGPPAVCHGAVPEDVMGDDALLARIASAAGPMEIAGSGGLPVLGIPLRAAGGAAVGILVLVGRGAAYPPSILALAQAVARPAALAIDRCRLMDRLRLLETAVSRLNDIVLITEADPIDAPDGPRIVYVNEAFVRLTGFAREEAMGRTPRILQGAGTDRAELDRIRQALHDRRAIRTELLNYTRSGRPIWLEIDIVPIQDADGSYTHLVAVERDVTERRQMDERLRQSQKLEAIGQLTGGVAHDFNNLLTVIIGNAELLAAGLADHPQLRPLAEMSVAAGERAADLTGRLLAFARRQPLQPCAVDLGRLVDGMQGLLRRALPEEVEVVVAAESGLWPVLVDPGQLEVAILNLALNARDAMPAGGRLRIAMANVSGATGVACADPVAEGDHVLLSVADTGSGMAPDVAARAFDPFFTTKEVGKGSGLGLSMVYGFVVQSKGRAWIESAVGQGTTVRLSLPRAPGAAAAGRAGAGTAAPGGSEHVLLVEGDPLVREHAERLLRGLGYRVTTAAGARQALDILGRHEGVDLLFTDLPLPGGMDGLQLAAAAGALQPGLRILLASGQSGQGVRGQGVRGQGVRGQGVRGQGVRGQGVAGQGAGTDGWPLVEKPYGRERLATGIRRALDGEETVQKI